MCYYSDLYLWHTIFYAHLVCKSKNLVLNKISLQPRLDYHGILHRCVWLPLDYSSINMNTVASWLHVNTNQHFSKSLPKCSLYTCNYYYYFFFNLNQMICVFIHGKKILEGLFCIDLAWVNLNMQIHTVAHLESKEAQITIRNHWTCSAGAQTLVNHKTAADHSNAFLRNNYPGLLRSIYSLIHFL